jgi:hypothetical protein
MFARCNSRRRRSQTEGSDHSISNQLKYIGTFSLYFTRQIYSLTMHYITHTHQSLSLYTWLRLVRSSHIHQKGKYILCQMSLQMAI